MKKMVLFGVITIVLFGLSASASYFWQMKQHAAAPEGTPKAPGKGADGTGHARSAQANGERGEEAPRAAVRPPYTPGTEEVARLASELRSRLAAVREREEQLAARKKQLDLIVQDLRGERAALDDLRKQVKNELESLNDALNGLEKQRSGLDQERNKVAQTVKKMEGRVVELQKEEHDNLKKMGSMYNTMAPESAARILQSMADTGKMETAVKVLGLMQERQAAKVLAEMSDTALAGQLLEKLKGLRRVPQATAQQTPKP